MGVCVDGCTAAWLVGGLWLVGKSTVVLLTRRSFHSSIHLLIHPSIHPPGVPSFLYVCVCAVSAQEGGKALGELVRHLPGLTELVLNDNPTYYEGEAPPPPQKKATIDSPITQGTKKTRTQPRHQATVII
jgi:hypothetical protein